MTLPIPIHQVAERLKAVPVMGVERGVAFPPILGQAIGQLLVSDLRMRMTRGISPNGQAYVPLAHGRVRGGTKPLLDTGVLRASINAKAEPFGATVGTNLHYAPVHQYGATITPKTKKFLAIPVTKQALRAGSPTRFPGRLSPRINKRTMKGVLVDEAGTVHYVLTQKVVIPARPFIGVSQEVVQEASQMVAHVLGAGWIARITQS